MPTGLMSSASTASRSSWVSVTMRFGSAGISTAVPVASLTVRVLGEEESALADFSPDGLLSAESEPPPQAVRSRTAAPSVATAWAALRQAVGTGRWCRVIKGSGINGT
ncbi:hypothetical protein SMICM304S_03067 [Streptomyces microflavus]